MEAPQETARVRGFVDATRRAIEQAERVYDVEGAARQLALLARPLSHPHEFHAAWKRIYLDQLYRDVAKFVLSFVGVHLLPGFRATQRSEAFDVFFDGPHVPVLNSVGVLMTQIAASKPQSTTASDVAADEAAQVLAQSVRLLQRVLEANGVRRLVDQLLQEDTATNARGNRLLMTAQPTISSLCSVPDLVFNRLQRATPSFFSPRSFYSRLCTELLEGLLGSQDTSYQSVVFRLFTEKLVRIGHMEDLVRAWLARRDLYDPTRADAHRQLVGALPISAFESFLQHLASAKAIPAAEPTASAPQYLLLSLLPYEVCTNKQFQFVVAHKLLLSKAVDNRLWLRMLVDTLATSTPIGVTSEAPLHAIFEVVLNRWSGDTFPLSVDYGLDSSIVFFLRYAMRRMDPEAFVDRDWTMKLCKGVQTHMAHSVERVRLLGMRVGESVSKVISPENVLNFEIAEEDPVASYSQVQFDFSQAFGSAEEESELQDDPRNRQKSVSAGDATQGKTKQSTKKTKGLAWMDPDEVAESDGEDDEEDQEDQGDGYDSDSDASLDAYDLHDDEEDLKPQRPVYIKDLLAGLHAEDEREKTETALAEAEVLLRRKPKDLHYSAKAVVQALLRLEDKYNTPNFVMLRAKALAAACALSPAAAVPYLQKQALEREQLLQSRVDVLQAMIAAAQELSETGAFRPHTPKKLLKEDIDSRTMEGLKTRRFGYRRDPLAPAKKNAFTDHALAFFSPLLFGYAHYVKQLEGSKRLSEVEDVFLAHLLHALSTFVECAGHAPAAIPMAKGLMEFAWHYRTNNAAAVRRQVLYAFSRVLLVMPPFLLRQELGQNIVEMMAWLQETNKRDPDDGCREASRLLLSSGAVPMLTMP